MKKISNKHLAFIDSYFSLNMNATAAYKSVYGSDLDDSVAGVNGNRLLRNAKIVEEIDKIKKANSKKHQITKDDLIKELIYLKNLHINNENASNGNVVINAINSIAKMLGFNEPEELTIKTDIQLIKLIEVKKDKK